MPRGAPITFRAFDGINNVADAYRLKPSELRAAVNVYVDDSRAALRRGGHGAPLAATAGAHSLFSHPEDGIVLYRLSTSLYRLFPDLSSTEIATGLTAGAKMAYAAAPGRVFMSDGFTQLQTDGETVKAWGIVPPAAQPVAAVAGTGKLPAGKYLYAVTYLRADGEESGTPASGAIELSSVAGIDFSGVPVSAQADVTMKCIYLTKANGKELRRAVMMPNAATTASYYGKGTDFRGVLTTQLMRGPPPGRVLAHMHGRMLVGDGRFLWYNPEPYRLELFSALKTRAHTGGVNALAVVDDGVFVGLDNKIDFHSGTDFVDAEVIPKAKYGACFGGVTYLEGDRVLRGMPGRPALMVTKAGLCVCGNQGVFQNVTNTRYQYTAPRSVAAVAREINGFAQLVAVMR